MVQRSIGTHCSLRPLNYKPTHPILTLPAGQSSHYQSGERVSLTKSLHLYRRDIQRVTYSTLFLRSRWLVSHRRTTTGMLRAALRWAALRWAALRWAALRWAALRWAALRRAALRRDAAFRSDASGYCRVDSS